MVYRVIGLMSGSSLDGLDICFTEIEETKGLWTFDIHAASCIPYNESWLQKLSSAKTLSAYDISLLHTEYGSLIGEEVNAFIKKYDLHHRIQLIVSHGHTVFHSPEKKMTLQIGSGAAIAAATGINTITDLRAVDVALGGQGAPIVPIGEKLFWPEINYFLNLGGIANITCRNNESFFAFDICAANRVLNMLAALKGKLYDDGGSMAESGNLHNELLLQLNHLDYYKKSYPKSLANEFGTDVIFPLISSFNLSVEDALRTYTEHIAQQIAAAVKGQSGDKKETESTVAPEKIMVTGGGAFNTFLISRLAEILQPLGLEIFLPANEIIQYKEALIMALIGVLRWREENTVLQSVTGASRSSIGGAVWMGQEA